MIANRLPARAGLHWVARGYRLFRRNPGFLNFLWFSTWLVLVGVSIVPLVGQAVASVVMPALLVGILNGCRAMERGEKVLPAMLFSGFAQPGRRTLLRIGLVYLLVSSLVFAVSMIFAGDELQGLMAGKDSPTGLDSEAAGKLFLLLVGTLQVALAVSLPTLVAAPLAAWYGLPVGKSLFFACVGILRNITPLLVLYGVLMVMSVGLPYALQSAIAHQPVLLKTLLQLAVMFALGFVFVPVALASFYLAIVDIFTDGRQDDVITA